MNEASTQPPALQIRNLRIGLPHGADRRFAVDGVNLEVAAGEILCLVGESGSGKSVIGQAVMRLLPPALPILDGDVRLEGRSVVDADERQLRRLRCTRMSMIFQEPMTALNPVMRCGGQIDEVLRAHTKLSADTRRQRIETMLRNVGLAEPVRMMTSYPHQLSGGQRQRIMIAMALVLEPVLLIADEPTTALDVTTQAQILSLLRDLQREHGTAILFVTHDFGVVADVADRVAVLRRGELVECGARARVLERPAHEYTRMLIGAVPSLTPRHRAPVADREPILQTRKLAKSYVGAGWLGRRKVVAAARDVSLLVRRGEVLGIVGESGSGKSTVARCIARLVQPTDGSIVVGSEDVAQLAATRLRPFRRRVQIVFQDPYRSLNPRRSVGESIVEGPKNYGASHREAWSRARRLMEMVRLDPRMLDRYPHEFSGGQRQRICIARALAMEPDLLIADEAVSALDVSVQAQVLALLDEIRVRLDLAMLFITHDLRVAAQLCHRVAVMSQGTIVEEGDVVDVFEHPRHPYTKTLLAAAPGRDFVFERDLVAASCSE